MAGAARAELTLVIGIWLQHSPGNALPALGDLSWAGGKGLAVLGWGGRRLGREGGENLNFHVVLYCPGVQL